MSLLACPTCFKPKIDCGCAKASEDYIEQSTKKPKTPIILISCMTKDVIEIRKSMQKINIFFYQPTNANLLRSLWWTPGMRRPTGLTPEVQAFVGRCFNAQREIEKVVIRGYDYTVCGYRPAHIFHCRGGRQRSVALVELTAAQLRAKGVEVIIQHRALMVKTTVEPATMAAVETTV